MDELVDELANVRKMKKVLKLLKDFELGELYTKEYPKQRDNILLGYINKCK